MYIHTYNTYAHVYTHSLSLSLPDAFCLGRIRDLTQDEPACSS